MLGEPGFRLAEGVVSGGGQGGASCGELVDTLSPVHDDAVQAMAGDVVARVGAAATAFDVDEADLLASGAYAKELLAAAEAAHVAMFAEDDRLLCYPSIVRVLPGDLALEIDRKRARGIRPSVVVHAPVAGADCQGVMATQGRGLVSGRRRRGGCHHPDHPR